MSSLLELCYRGVPEVSELGSPKRDQSEPQHGLSLATFSGYDAILGLAETFPCLSTDQGTTQPQEGIRVAFSRTLGLQQQQQRQHLVTCTFEPFDDDDDEEEEEDDVEAERTRLRMMRKVLRL